jgi:hypothetical protein
MVGLGLKQYPQRLTSSAADVYGGASLGTKEEPGFVGG